MFYGYIYHMSVENISNFSEAPNPVKYARSHDRIKKVSEELWGLNVVGAENIPSSGACILAPKHNSLLDPFFIGAIVNRALYSMARKELWTDLRWRWITGYLEDRGAFPVDRSNYSGDSLARSLALLKEKKMLAISPEGTSKNRQEIVGNIQEGVGWLATKAAHNGIDCPIVAIGITGKHPWKFEPIDAVVAKPFYPDIDGKSSKIARREATERLHDVLQDAQNQSIALRDSHK